MIVGAGGEVAFDVCPSARPLPSLGYEPADKVPVENWGRLVESRRLWRVEDRVHWVWGLALSRVRGCTGRMLDRSKIGGTADVFKDW
jgi:hypothetical protein